MQGRAVKIHASRGPQFGLGARVIGGEQFEGTVEVDGEGSDLELIIAQIDAGVARVERHFNDVITGIAGKRDGAGGPRGSDQNAVIAVTAGDSALTAPERDRVVTKLSENRVVTQARIDHVIAVATVNGVIADAGCDGVVACVTVDGVAAVTGVDLVVTFTALDFIGTGTCENHIISGPTLDAVITTATDELIIATTAQEAVIPEAAFKVVISQSAQQCVIALATDHPHGRLPDVDQRIVAGAAFKFDRGTNTGADVEGVISFLSVADDDS